MNIIPMFASAGITGFESPASDYRQLPLSLAELLVEHPSATFIGKASGESMQGVGIFDGDILVVDRHVTARDGDVIVANLNGEFICKLLDVPRRLLENRGTDTLRKPYSQRQKMQRFSLFFLG
ncbi:S24 family peptidase [Enterovibrio norvegicus]|uniref:S24 family peptidase n=1 Tax=Enterovibrio norvegicus TaxID=188144 RepID=UPI001F52F2C1|nr:S24 family peptidase [Enterovibrio norvegicus]